MSHVDHHPGQELLSMVRLKRFVRIRHRLRCVALAMEGRTAPEIAVMVGLSRRTVQAWVRRYNEEGVDGLQSRPLPGQPTKLKRADEASFIARIDAGPTDADAVCTLRGEDIRRILEDEFGAKYSLNGVYDLLHRLGYSRLRPRPRHRDNDPEAAERWVRDAPLLSVMSRSSIPTSASRSGSRTKRGSVSRAL
jgi:transposase